MRKKASITPTVATTSLRCFAVGRFCAEALHAAGRREPAERLFADAEGRQQKMQPAYPLLYSLPGYRYCDLLLSKGEHAAARKRAHQTLEWVRPRNWLLEIALDTLTLARARLASALSTTGARPLAADALARCPRRRRRVRPSYRTPARFRLN